MKSVVLLLMFSTALIGQNPNKYRLSIGGHYISTTDYSIQTPDGENAFNSLVTGWAPSFEAQVNFSFSKLFQFETGYRYKQHFISYKSTRALSADLIATAHSIPLRIGIASKFGRSRLLNRLSFGLGVGVLLDFMQRPDISHIRTDQQFQIRSASSTYVTADYYNPDEVNQVKTSVSFNGQLQLSYKILKFMHVYIGYGYTQGTRTLGKGHYLIVDSGALSRGSMIMKGSYKYNMLGVRFFL